VDNSTDGALTAWIIVGCFLFLVLVGIAVFFGVRQYKKKKDEDTAAEKVKETYAADVPDAVASSEAVGEAKYGEDLDDDVVVLDSGPEGQEETSSAGIADGDLSPIEVLSPTSPQTNTELQETYTDPAPEDPPSPKENNFFE